MTTPAIELIHRHGSVRQCKPVPLPTELVGTIVAVTDSISRTCVRIAEIHSWVTI